MTLAAIDPNLRWYLTLGLLSGALVVGVSWAHRVWSDVKGEDDESSNDPDELIAPLTEAFAAGQMSDEEYLRIKQSVERTASAGEVAPTLPIRPKVVRAEVVNGTESALPDPVPPEAPG